MDGSFDSWQPAGWLRHEALLAPYAQRASSSRGREHPEPEHPYRSPFARDRDRIVHSAAFRRLSGKMQVFTGEMGDYHRTRLTHTLEVSGLARTMAGALGLNESLVEVLALMHDLGHPPFGHTGEQALDRVLCDEGGFNHNRQTLRIVDRLERRWLPVPGLNLSREVLDGQRCRAEKHRAGPAPSLEVQVVDAADSVAYDTHDADDALVLGLITLDDLLETRLWSAASQRFRTRYAQPSDDELRRGVVHELINWQMTALLTATQSRIAAAGVDTPEAACQAGVLVAPDDELAELKLEFERYLFARVYRHHSLCTMRERVTAMIGELFARLLDDPDRLPREYREGESLPRAVADFLACQTDRSCEQLADALLGQRLG